MTPNTNAQRFTTRVYTTGTVREARYLRSKGVTCKAIAVALGMSPQYVSRICNGTRRKVD